MSEQFRQQTHDDEMNLYDKVSNLAKREEVATINESSTRNNGEESKTLKVFGCFVLIFLVISIVSFIQSVASFMPRIIFGMASGSF